MSHISARVGEIRRQLGLLTPAPPAATSTPSGTSTSSSRDASTSGTFSAVLAGEVARTSGSATTAATTMVMPASAGLGTARAYVPGTPVPVVPAATVTTPSGAVTPGAAVTATPTPTLTLTPATSATGTSPAGSLTADGTPTELARYRNGRIPSSALTPIGGGHKLWAPAADAFRAMTAAAAREGVRIGITDSYRSYDAQVDVARRKGLYKNGGLAAVPGTSDHGWGRSVDLDLDRNAQAWMRAHGDAYGFVEDTPREPWHWTYSPPS